jgi:uncharacterized protein
MSFHDDDAVSNSSNNPTLNELIERSLSRRTVLAGGLGAASAAVFGCGNDAAEQIGRLGEPLVSPGIGFSSVAVSTADAVVVADGYTASVLYSWGDPTSDGPAFATDASNSAADQEQQAGMHHDGISFFSLPSVNPGRQRGLLVMNHEYTDDGLLHAGGMDPWTAEKVQKSQAAHGVSVIEVELSGGAWQVVRPSSYARRVTAYTPIAISGPAAGHALMHTPDDPSGMLVLGTLNNCANGQTPWGTYLACEENFNGYFVNKTTSIESDDFSDDEKTRLLALQKRYGIGTADAGYRWSEHDPRFDAAKNPQESNRFGWITEINPHDPTSLPVKRTALGRFKHENAAIAESVHGYVTVYMGDDERFEYLYKFTSARPWRAHVARGESPLDYGKLYVAKFNADGSGEWLLLEYGSNGLDESNGFESQADVVIEARRAADVAGATKMDRPEFVAVHPRGLDRYVTLTNNTRRGSGTNSGPDAANPRSNNVFGHIMKWTEGAGPFATAFSWEIFVLCGDPANTDTNKQGNIIGDVFGSPDGLAFDAAGRLWIETDISSSTVGTGDYANFGNNMMLCADPVSHEIRRFLTGPKNCEVTGIAFAPDQRTLFINIQHPGEPSTERSDPANPTAVSSWPSGVRPRSSTLVIRKNDGGVIGT